MDVKHVGIILDGNRRWAREKGIITYLGHKAGAENLEKLAIEADKIGLKYLTVYIFSTENWNRDKEEVDYLMKLFIVFFRKVLKSKENNLKIKFFSSKTNLNSKFIKMIEELEETTKNNTGMQLNLCFNYGGRLEITEAISKIVDDVQLGKLKKEDITEEIIPNYLYSKNVPDPEIIIRTSGEMRLSNFLIWQNSYSELFFEKKYWPDFRIEDLKNILESFQNRERRFGGK